ncbi:hypothetical protein INT43_004832, partial [Umbelopsis isabellina]
QISLMFLKSLIVLTISASATALTASTISGCPALTPRSSPATTVHDLRIDDIKMVAALGDSITAGFAAKGVQGPTIVNLANLNEDRGVSFAMGGDPGAVTLATLMKNYQPKLHGASLGEHLVEASDLCPPFQYKPSSDVLNAAQSGGLAENLDHELDYLIAGNLALAMATLPGGNFLTDWKLITIQIGSNDQCSSCNTNNTESTPQAYGNYVRAAVQKIQKYIPRVIVNLVGEFRVSPVYTVTANQSYCQPFTGSTLEINSIECSCAKTAAGKAFMDQTCDGYNAQLQQIYQDYKALNSPTFAVVYTPANIQVGTFPIQAFSNIDCFHPSVLAHQWIAKVIWNQLFLPQSSKPTSYSFDANLQINCPASTDRIQLN